MTTTAGVSHVADREGAATNVIVVPTRRRRSISPELFETYWQNCHGPVVSAMPGLDFYYQHRMLPDYGDNWPRLTGISNEVDDSKQFDGIAQLGWSSIEDLEVFQAASDAADMPVEEGNMFGVLAIQSSGPGSHKTFFDGLLDPHANGPEPHLRLFAGFRVAPGASRAEFGRHLMDRVAPAFAEHELTRRVRLTLCEDVNYLFRRTGLVTVDIPLEDQYQAFLEFVVADRYDLGRFYSSDGFADAVSDLSDVVGHANVFPTKSTMVCVQQGAMTLAGQLGMIRAQAVRSIGATNVPLPA